MRPLQLLLERVREPPAGFDAAMQSEALRLLEDPEVRVRLAAGGVLGALCGRRGVAAFREARRRVLTSILEHYVSSGWRGQAGRLGMRAGSTRSALSECSKTAGSHWA
jgi:hypothetical protein